MDDSPKLIIDKTVLEELHQIALIDRVDKIETLDYRPGQQVLTINSLIKWMESYGLQAPFKLEI